MAAALATRWHHAKVPLALMASSVFIELVSSSARVTLVKSTNVCYGRTHRSYVPQEYLGLIKINWSIQVCIIQIYHLDIIGVMLFFSQI